MIHPNCFKIYNLEEALTLWWDLMPKPCQPVYLQTAG